RRSRKRSSNSGRCWAIAGSTIAGTWRSQVAQLPMPMTRAASTRAASRLIANSSRKSIRARRTEASAAEPPRDGHQREDEHPDHECAPDQADRAGHRVHVGIVAQAELGTKADGAVMMQRLAQAHAERAGSTCEHHALLGIHPRRRLRAPAVHRVLEV